jgi:large subunit ribosomal protein L30e
MGKRRGRNKSSDDDAIDIDKMIAMVVSTGKVKLGGRTATRESRGTRAKAYIVAENCPENINKEILYNSSFALIPVIKYPKSSFELGATIGRPHKVAVITVYDPGNSKILDLADNEEFK